MWVVTNISDQTLGIKWEEIPVLMDGRSVTETILQLYGTNTETCKMLFVVDGSSQKAKFNEKTAKIDIGITKKTILVYNNFVLTLS